MLWLFFFRNSISRSNPFDESIDPLNEFGEHFPLLPRNAEFQGRRLTGSIETSEHTRA
jgi:hypothetical protein